MRVRKGGELSIGVVVLVVSALTVGVAPVPSASAADPLGFVTDFTDPTIHGPTAIVAGPDGNLWFTNGSNSDPISSIGRITTAGVVTNFTDPGIHLPGGIAAGSDGNLWFTVSGTEDDPVGSIGRITTSGVITYFTDPAMDPAGIAAGPDGNLWFTNFDRGSLVSSIGRITTAGVVTYFTDPTINAPWNIVAGPDGNLWFANFTPPLGSIGRITTAGVVTNFSDPTISAPGPIAVGPDGNLWFRPGGDSIGRITTAGVVTTFTHATIDGPWGIAAGPDGNVWFANQGGDSIGRITTAGVVTNFTHATMNGPNGIAAGPDGNLWFTNDIGDSIGRIGTAPLPLVSIGDASVVEGNARARQVKLTVSLSKPSTKSVTVKYATKSGTASAGADFVGRSGTVTIPAGGTSAVVTIEVKGDRTVEANEAFTVKLTNPQRAVRWRTTGTATISNDDSPSRAGVRVSIGNALLVEGHQATRALRFAVTLSESSPTTPVRVHYATSPGTAGAADFTPTSGTVTIPARAVSGVVSVRIKSDTLDEPTERFTVRLSNPTGATLHRTTATGTINDDD
jgi:streptogramin lyase